MNTREAKDFIVQQASEQAMLENVSLTDLEKRMMYFTETDPASCEDPLALNAEFEAQYDTPEYEAKIAGLLSRAYKRLKTENPEKARYWDDVIRTLKRGDHYVLVMWRNSPLSEAFSSGLPENPSRKSGNNVVRCGAIALVVFFVMAALMNVKYLPSWVLPTLGMLLFVLCVLTMFFLAQQGYRALRSRKSSAK